MKNNYLNKIKNTIFFSAIILLCVNTSYAQFTAGNITVLQVGDGVSTLTNTGNQIILKEFTPTGTPAFSLSVPATGTNALINSGSATSEGALSLSSNGQFLVFGGYNAATGFTASISGSSSTLIARGVGVVNTAGNYSLAATSNTFFTTNNMRGATSDGVGNFWASGNGNGTNYFGNTAIPAIIQNSITNTRCIIEKAGGLYFSTGSGTQGIYTIPTSTTTGPAPFLFINTAASTGSTSSPFAFYANATNTVMYIADDRSFVNGGGIQKFVNTGIWTYAYTIATGTVGARGVVADFSNAIPFIYATTSETSANRLVVIVDIGAGSTATTIATSGTNTIFRGIAFSPTTCTTPTITIVATNNSVCPGNSSLLTASGTASTFSWSTGSTMVNTTVNPTVTTVYSLTTTVASCSLVTTKTIVVNSLPTIVVNSPSLCLGSSATLTVSGAFSYTWSTGFIGANTVVSPTITTNYSVTGVSLLGCINTNTTSVMVMVCTGLKESITNTNVKLFPNPVKDALNISFNEQGIYTLTVIDALGKVIYNVDADKNHTINTSTFTQGMYVLKVKSTTKQNIYKFIKN